MHEDLIPIDHQRALKYLAMVEQAGTSISARDLNAFYNLDLERFRSNEPVAGRFGYSGLVFSRSLSSYMSAMNVDERAIEISEAFMNLGWVINSRSSIILTPLGQGLVKLLVESEKEESGVFVLLPGDPMNWNTLYEAIENDRGEYLVDPYLDPVSLQWISAHTGISRVLTSEAHSDRDKDRIKKLRVFVEKNPSLSLPEIRFAPKELLHDRYVFGQESGSLLGTSINHWGKKLSTIAPLTGPPLQAVKDAVREIWETAERLNPAEGTGP